MGVGGGSLAFRAARIASFWQTRELFFAKKRILRFWQRGVSAFLGQRENTHDIGAFCNGEMEPISHHMELSAMVIWSQSATGGEKQVATVRLLVSVSAAD